MKPKSYTAHKAVWPALSFLFFLLLASCGFLPSSEEEYIYRKEVLARYRRGEASHYLRDGFETNDGKISLSYAYEHEAWFDGLESPAVSRDWASSGQYSLKIPQYIQLNFLIDAKEAGILSLDTSAAGFESIDVDGSSVWSGLVDPETGAATMRRRFAIPEGKHRVKLPVPTDAPMYIDELRFDPILSGASPEAGGLAWGSSVLDWDDIPEASPYRLQLSLDEDFADIALDLDDLTESRAVLPADLVQGRRYYWRVSAWRTPDFTAWTLPSTFLCPDSPVDEDFEGSISGNEVLNAWGVGGAIYPKLIPGSGIDGSGGLRLDFPGADWTSYEPSSLKLGYELASPKLVRFSYKFGYRFSPPSLCIEFKVLPSGRWASGYRTNGQTWTEDARLLDSGRGTLEFSLRGTTYPYDSWLLLDNVSFEDIPGFTSDGFESGGDGKALFDYGFGGYSPPSIIASEGIGSSACASIPSYAAAMGLFPGEDKASHLSLVADFGSGAFTLRLKAKYTYYDAMLVLLVDGAEAQRTSRLASPGNTGWYEYSFSIPEGGAHELWIRNMGGSVVYVDDVEVLR